MATSLAMRLNPLSFLVFIFGMMSAFFAIYAWRNRATRGSHTFAVFMASMTVYVLGYSMELASLDLSTMLFWNKIEYLGIFSFPTLFLIFVLHYTGRDQGINWKTILLLFVIPTILLVAKFTDDTFHLVYSSTWMDTSGSIPLLGFTRGPLYLVAVYAVVPVTVGIILLLIKRSNALPLYRTQTTLIVISAMSLLLVYILYLLGLQPFPTLNYLDLNALVYPLWAVWLGLAIFRYGLFSISPAAREALVERMSDAVFVLDHHTRLVDSNPVAKKVMGWIQPPLGQKASDIFSIWKDQWQVSLTEKVSDESKIEIRHVSGEKTVFFDLNITPLRNKKKKNIGQLLVLHDITELKELQQELMELSLVDELTGLYNRRGFYILASQFLQMVDRMNSRAALAYLDLDTMKMINDTYGHAEGDRTLVKTADLLRTNLRSSDILARFGGDEFIALGIEIESGSAEKMLARIEKQFTDFNAKSDQKYPILISYGVAHYDPRNPCSLEELMIEADKAMYEHKQSKRHDATNS